MSDPPRALARGLELLEAVAACPGGCPFRTFSRQLGLPNTSVARLLRGLCALGYLRHDAERALYVPGERLGWLGSQEDVELRLRRLAMPQLRRLAARHHVTALLLRWTGRHVICIDRVEGPQAHLFQGIGHVTQDPAQAPWGPFTHGTPGDALGRRWWRAQLARLESHGWTACRDPRRRRLAAPLRDAAGTVTGVMVLAGLPIDLDPVLEGLGSELAAAAAACSGRNTARSR